LSCANVAAVSYHFGSTHALLHTTIEQALETLTRRQIDGLELLGPDLSLAAASAGPVIDALSGPATGARTLTRSRRTPPPILPTSFASAC
jgi:AcrR family transcriptional regulator